MSHKNKSHESHKTENHIENQHNEIAEHSQNVTFASTAGADDNQASYVVKINDSYGVKHVGADGMSAGIDNIETLFGHDESNEMPDANNNTEEVVLAGLFQAYFNRDATINEWGLAMDALSYGVSSNDIFSWFLTPRHLGTLIAYSIQKGYRIWSI